MKNGITDNTHTIIMACEWRLSMIFVQNHLGDTDYMENRIELTNSWSINKDGIDNLSHCETDQLFYWR